MKLWIVVFLVSPTIAYACPSLELDHQVLPDALTVRLLNQEPHTQILVELFFQNTSLHRVLLRNDSVSFPRSQPGDYVLRAEVIYPFCEGVLFRDVVVGPLSRVHYRSSTIRLWPLSVVLLLFITTILSLVLLWSR